MTPLAPLARPSVAVDGFRAEREQAWTDREIHIATCRPRRQRLACSMCWRVAERLDQAEARLERAEKEVPAQTPPPPSPASTRGREETAR